MMSELPYLPSEIKQYIISLVDDIDIRRYFGVYSRIPRDWRFDVLLNRPLIHQTSGKYHPTSGAFGPPYGEVVIPRRGGDLYITVLPIRGMVSWEDYTDHPYKGITRGTRFYL